MFKKRILILDDDEDWIKLLTRIIEKDGRFMVNSVHNNNEWDERVTSASYWDAIIVDIKLTGGLTGSKLAACTIREHGVMSPIIIITLNANLAQEEKEYGDIFFKYIHKNNINRSLVSEISKACEHDERYSHIKKMLTAFCKKFNILNNNLTQEQINDDELSKYFASANGSTFKDLIDLLYGTRNILDNCGKKIMKVINLYYK